MSRTRKKSTLNWKLLLILISIPVLCFFILAYQFGWLNVMLGFGVIMILIVLFRVYARYKKRRLLLTKYGDEKLVADIEQGYFWQGQTAEQLTDSLGEPDDVDEEVLKTKTKSVWKYNHLGGNRYGLRIKLDDLIVTGWDQKD